jgi:hypothetical protein
MYHWIMHTGRIEVVVPRSNFAGVNTEMWTPTIPVSVYGKKEFHQKIIKYTM